MDINNETNPNEMIEKTETQQSIEVGTQEELEKRVTETIVALVNKANAIAEENSVIEKPKLYEVGEATEYINKTDTKAGDARTKYNELKGMPEAHFWTIGRNKAKAEKTQAVLVDIIDAIDNNANATKALFNAQTKLAEFSNKLYAIGLMGIASNRMVVRQIKLRLEHASEEELSELARQELESVLYELKLQQSIAEKVDRVEANLNEANEKHDQLAKHVNENHADVLAKIEDTNNALKCNENQLNTKVNEVNERGNQLAKRIEENYKTLKSSADSHDKRLKVLEKKSFFDTSVYKVLLGIVALGALIISLVNYYR